MARSSFSTSENTTHSLQMLRIPFLVTILFSRLLIIVVIIHFIFAICCLALSHLVIEGPV